MKRTIKLGRKSTQVFLVLSFAGVFSCGQLDKVPIQEVQSIEGFYTNTEYFIQLRKDSSFIFGVNGGVLGVLASGHYGTEGIRLNLYTENTPFLSEEEKAKTEKGYIDYPNHIVYVYGHRLVR